MNARRDLDDHTPTLYIGSKIRLHGLTNQAFSGEKRTVLGMARISHAGANAWVDGVAHLVPKVARNGVIDGKTVHLHYHAPAESDTSRALADP